MGEAAKGTEKKVNISMYGVYFLCNIYYTEEYI